MNKCLCVAIRAACECLSEHVVGDQERRPRWEYANDVNGSYLKHTVHDVVADVHMDGTGKGGWGVVVVESCPPASNLNRHPVAHVAVGDAHHDGAISLPHVGKVHVND